MQLQTPYRFPQRHTLDWRSDNIASAVSLSLFLLSNLAFKGGRISRVTSKEISDEKNDSDDRVR
jgi:hypothetical protein